jgi:cytochrome c556
MGSFRFLRSATLVTLVVASAAAAHGHATGVVKERMDAMKSMDRSVKDIKELFNTSKADLAKVKAEALSIQTHAAKITTLFPAGSMQHPTDAKASLWKNWPDFESKAQALQTESTKLAQADPSNRDALRAQFKAMNQTCTACHKLYRADR